MKEIGMIIIGRNYLEEVKGDSPSKWLTPKNMGYDPINNLPINQTKIKKVITKEAILDYLEGNISEKNYEYVRGEVYKRMVMKDGKIYIIGDKK